MKVKLLDDAVLIALRSLSWAYELLKTNQSFFRTQIKSDER
jgi:hypothetical protein